MVYNSSVVVREGLSVSQAFKERICWLSEGWGWRHGHTELHVSWPHLTPYLAPLQELTDPMMVMFEMPEEEQEGMQEENTFEVTEAIPDVELFEYKTSTRSIHVLSGA